MSREEAIKVIKATISHYKVDEFTLDDNDIEEIIGYSKYC